MRQILVALTLTMLIGTVPVFADESLKIRLQSLERAVNALAEHSKPLLPSQQSAPLSWDQQMANYDLRALAQAAQAAVRNSEDPEVLSALSAAIAKVQISLPKARLDQEGQRVAALFKEELSLLQDALDPGRAELDSNLGPSLRPSPRSFGYGYGWDWGDPYWGYSGPWTGPSAWGPGPWGAGPCGPRNFGYPNYPSLWRY